jgi:hypothetical protein
MAESVLKEEEKQQIAAIIRRWRRHANGISLLPLLCAIVALCLFALFSSWRLNEWGFLVSSSIGLAGIICSALVRVVTNRRFARSLSQEECELLGSTSDEEARKVSINAGQLLVEVRKLTPQKELLRASQPMPDETLLRASVRSEDVPQEQLLRAANGVESK